MRSEAPPLLPILRSRHQADLLTLLYLHPDQEYTLTELASRLAIPLTTVQREVGRLVESDLISERRVGRSRLVSANARSRYARPLTELLTLAFGPHVIVEEEFADIAGVEAVGLFGSWAARYTGETGPPPNDVDVLVLGRPERGEIYEAAEQAEQRLGFPVNPVIVSRHRWKSAADALVRQVRSSPMIWVSGAAPGDE